MEENLDIPAFLRRLPGNKVPTSDAVATSKGEDAMSKIGTKEQQIRSLKTTPTASAPANPEAATAAETAPKESIVRTKTSKKSSKAKARKGIKGKTKAAKKGDGAREGSKLEAIGKLLRREQGCTSKDIMEATGWPSVSVPQQAKALGITLKTEKEGRVTRYRAAA